MTTELFRKQVDLLIQLIPLVAAEDCFALKGGTAINLFIRDMPRLSVDIDLTYMLFDGREVALKNISDALRRIREGAEKLIIGARGNIAKQGDDIETRLVIICKGVQVQIEVNTVMRGHIMPAKVMKLTPKAVTEFGKYAKMLVMSYGEIYGGKLSAALNRQHPRDLFDVRMMLDGEGITEEVKKGLVCALVSQARPIHELLSPNFLNQETAFNTQFKGMTDYEFTYEAFELTRKELMNAITAAFTQSDKDFLVSFVEGQPEWEKPGIPFLENQPAVKWKLENVKKLIVSNPKKNQEQLENLKRSLQL